VNEGSKYPITAGGDRMAIGCDKNYCALFGANKKRDIGIKSNSNNNTDSWCWANKPSFKLPASKGEGYEEGSSSINGGKNNF
jgi:hypothetical protein